MKATKALIIFILMIFVLIYGIYLIKNNRKKLGISLVTVSSLFFLFAFTFKGLDSETYWSNMKRGLNIGKLEEDRKQIKK